MSAKKTHIRRDALFAGTEAGKEPRISTSPASAFYQKLASANPLFWLLFVCLCTAALCLPFIRAGWLGDEGIWLHGAVRLMRGDRLYVDFFELHPPLGFLLLQGWLTAFGTTLLSARLLVVLTFVVIAGATFVASWRAGANSFLSALIILAWVVSSQGLWTQANHHWFTTAFSMIALVCALSPASTSAGFAGLAAGAAVMVTPPRGLLILIASSGAFLSASWKRRLLFMAGTAVVPCLSLLWVLMFSEFDAAYRDVITFNATRYSDVQWTPFGYGGGWQSLLAVLAFPYSAILLFALAMRSRRILIADRTVRICAFFAMAGFIGCFPRPDYAHILFAVPLAIPLIVAALSRLEFSLPLTRLAGALFILALVAPAKNYLATARSVWTGRTIPTAAGMVTFPNSLADEGRLIESIWTQRRNEPVLFYPYLPSLAFLTRGRHTARADVFVPFYTTREQYYEACTQTMAAAAWVVIDPRWSDPEMLHKAFPAMPRYFPHETSEFEKAIARSFPVQARFGPLEMRKRSAASSCDGILAPAR